MCPVEKRGFLSRYLLCQNCSVRAERSGGLFIVFGLALAVAGSFVMPFEAAAAVVGFGMCAFGGLRLSRQFAAHRRWLVSHSAGAAGAPKDASASSEREPTIVDKPPPEP